MTAGCDPASAAKVKNDHSIIFIAFSVGIRCRRESTGTGQVGRTGAFFILYFCRSQYDLFSPDDPSFPGGFPDHHGSFPRRISDHTIRHITIFQYIKVIIVVFC